jgi:hypothetical protein
MDIANRYSSGDAITDLRNASKARAETNFNEMINSIDTKASDEGTLYGSIQKAGASITAVGAIGKGVLTNYQKLKDKINGKEEDTTAEDGEDGANVGGEEGGTEIEMSGITTETPYMTSEVDDVATTGGQDVGNLADFGEAAGDTAEGVGDTAGGLLSATGATRDIPTESFEPAEEAVDEGVELGADATLDAAQSGLSAISSTLGSVLSSASTALGNISSVGSAVSSAIASTSSAVSGAIDSTTGAISTGVEAGVEGAAVAGEVAGASALEAAGTALDATPAFPVGIILNLIGGLVLGGTMTAGIVGDVTANNDQQTESQTAQNTLSSATSGGLSNIAGRYGV